MQILRDVRLLVGNEKWHFYKENDEDEQKETLYDTKKYSYNDFINMSAGEIKGLYETLPWKEYIVVFIELPD